MIMLIALSGRMISRGNGEGINIASGSVAGYVSNYYGLAISGAIVGLENGPATISGADGYYFLEGLTEGDQTIGCGKTGYNLTLIIVNVISGDTVDQNFTLTQPAMVLNPLFINETINPGEYFTTPLNVLNNGTGPLGWQAVIDYISTPKAPCDHAVDLYTSRDANEWLTMDYYEGTVPPFGGVANVPTHLNAVGMNSGDVYNANIVFTSIPFVGEIIIPVVMNILGNEILAPDNLIVELLDDVTGEVELTWDWSGDAFQFFMIKRNGMIIGTTTSQSYFDVLNDHGIYCYTVQAFYDEGSSTPAGPECVEWSIPVLHVDPNDLYGWVWTGFTVDVYTTISNLGEGTLAYTFPEFAALNLLNDPNIEKNKPGTPPETQCAIILKGDERYDGTGYPIILGAGGPDDFGYIWIDSDEPGGPTFNFTDISTTGIPIYGLSDDNIVGPFDIDFDFYFYGENKTQFWVNSNGCIGFSPGYITLGNTEIPTNNSFYIDFIAWMWDDLNFRTGSSQVFYQTISDKLIIQFKNYEYFNQADKYINAEVIICKNGKIMVMYDNFSAGVTLNSCTIGLQSSTPGIGLQVAFNTSYLHNELAVSFYLPSDFISDVQPASGTVPEGGSQVITITYDSREYTPGPYIQVLLLESNDLNNEEYVIDNTMYVYLPARFAGIVYDKDNEEPLNGVIVTAGPFQATTGENGEYNLYVDEGNYDVIFEKLGYMTVTVEDTSVLQDQITPLNVGMWDMNYPPGFVHTEVMANDSWCQVTWALPNGPYEIIMDDGEADDFFVYAHAGSWNAVKFTPSGYPATVIGGKFYVGDGSFPGPFLGTGFGVAVFDDDGADGLPGTLLDSNSIIVNNSGWVSLDCLNAVIYDGSFYLAMFQSGNAPFAAPIGIDSDNPTYFKSYSKFLANDWSLSPFQDFMIRAWVNGPEGEGMSNRNVINYRVARYSGFDPDGSPAAGTLNELTNTLNLYYNEYAWEAFTPGWYAYGVKVLYTSGVYSDYIISNIVGHLMDCQVSVNTSLTTGLEPVDVEVTLQGLEYPYKTYFAVTPASGTISFDMVWKGRYDITLFKIGYDTYKIENTSINTDKVFNIMLSEKKYPPACLDVDPVSLEATWCEPLRTVLKEDFEDPVFPPPGWQNLTHCDTTAWIRTESGSTSGWIVPAWDSFYAVYNDGFAGSDCNGCCDYLITPPVDLRESENFSMTFNSFYDGLYGQLAFVEYSVDEGATWEVLYQVMPATSWTDLELDLGAFSGETGPAQLWFAFHADDAGEFASGWAIDNIVIQSPAPAAGYLDFSVFLNNVFVGSTTETNWDFAPLAYGQTYTASVAARYSSGLSSKDYCTFESNYLFPPQNLTGIAPDNAAILFWDPPGTDLPVNLLGYNIYRDEIFVDYIIHAGGWDPQYYVEENLQPGIYSYTITGLYDLALYGLPGETGESMEEGPAGVTVDFCFELEFMETWALGSFDPNNWVADGANWMINSQAGNPAPAAEFTWDPIQTNYEISLESYPLCAEGLTEGNIWLDFDLKLDAFQPKGEEMLNVQVWNWNSRIWSTVAGYSNIDGSFNWTSEHINIKALAMNMVFKVRFQAKGVNSLNIQGWYVDNVHIYRACAGPENLTVDPDFYEGIRLIWQHSENSMMKAGINEGDDSREFSGFNIFRSVNGGEYELHGSSYGMEYIDPESSLIMGSYYCYMVNAVYNSETDQCESAFSNEECVLWTDITENYEASSENFSLYPNPANDHVYISTSNILKRVTIYNASGQQIFDQITTGRQLELNTNHYTSGLYLIRAETESGVTTRILTIQR